MSTYQLTFVFDIQQCTVRVAALDFMTRHQHKKSEKNACNRATLGFEAVFFENCRQLLKVERNF